VLGPDPGMTRRARLEIRGREHAPRPRVGAAATRA
jgi:hypothetical protein